MSVMEATSPLAQSISARRKGSGKTIKDLMEGRADLYKLNPFDISIEEGFNVRDITTKKVQDHIDGLAQSIAKVGLKRPLKVRMKDGVPVLVDGECRLRAVMRAIDAYDAEIRTVKVELADRAMSEADATLSLVIENGGLDINVLEKAAAFRRLENFGWSLEDIAAGAGISVNRVMQLIEHDSIPDAVKQMIRNDEIAPTLAWSIAKENDFDEKRTLKCIKAAMKAARSAGRTKVTARHVASRPSLKATLSTMMQEIDICTDDEDDMVIASFTRDQFDVFQKALKLNLI